MLGKPSMRSGRRWAAVAAIAVVVTAASACGSDDAGGADTTAADTTVVDTTTAAAVDTTAAAATVVDTTTADTTGRLSERVSIRAAVPVAGIESFAPLYLAKELGVFDDENLDVEIVVLPAPDILTELLRGSIDVYPVGYQANVFNAISAGNDLAYVAPVHTPPEASQAGIYVRSDLVGSDGEFDPCEFEGKTVSFGGAAGFAATSAWWFSDFIAECDLTLKDIQLSTVGGAEQLIALESGALDAAFLFDPLWSQAEAAGTAELVVLGPKVALGGYLMGSLRSEQPEVAAAFVRALKTTIDEYLQGDYHSDPEVRAALIQALGVPEAGFDGGVSLKFDPSLQIDTSPIIPMQQVWIGVGDILQYDEPLQPDALIDPSVLEAATG